MQRTEGRACSVLNWGSSDSLRWGISQAMYWIKKKKNSPRRLRVFLEAPRYPREHWTSSMQWAWCKGLDGLSTPPFKMFLQVNLNYINLPLLPSQLSAATVTTLLFPALTDDVPPGVSASPGACILPISIKDSHKLSGRRLLRDIDFSSVTCVV